MAWIYAWRSTSLSVAVCLLLALDATGVEETTPAGNDGSVTQPNKTLINSSTSTQSVKQSTEPSSFTTDDVGSRTVSSPSFTSITPSSSSLSTPSMSSASSSSSLSPKSVNSLSSFITDSANTIPSSAVQDQNSSITIIPTTPSYQNNTSGISQSLQSSLTSINTSAGPVSTQMETGTSEMSTQSAKLNMSSTSQSKIQSTQSPPVKKQTTIFSYFNATKPSQAHSRTTGRTVSWTSKITRIYMSSTQSPGQNVNRKDVVSADRKMLSMSTTPAQTWGDQSSVVPPAGSQKHYNLTSSGSPSGHILGAVLTPIAAILVFTAFYLFFYCKKNRNRWILPKIVDNVNKFDSYEDKGIVCVDYLPKYDNVHLNGPSTGGQLYRVAQSFDALEPGHIDLQLGQSILVTQKPDSGWWRGSVGSRRGWFPAACVEPIGGPGNERAVDADYKAVKKSEKYSVTLHDRPSVLFKPGAITEDHQMESVNEENTGHMAKMYRVSRPFIPFGKGKMSLAQGDIIIHIATDEAKNVMLGHKVKAKKTGWFPSGNVVPIEWCSDIIVKNAQWNPRKLLKELNQIPTEQYELFGLEFMATEDFSGIHEDHLSIIKGQKVTVVEMNDDWIRGCHGNQDGWFPRKCVQGINTGSKVHSKHEGKTNSVSPLPILNTSLHLLGPFTVTVVDRSTLKKPLYELHCPKDGLQSDDADSVLDEADPTFVPLKKNSRICSDMSPRDNLVQSQNGNVPCGTVLETEMDATPSEPRPPVPGTLPPEEEESGVESMSSKDLDEVQDTPRGGICSVEIDNGDENDNVTVIRITNQGTSHPDTELTPRESLKTQTDKNSNDISSNMQNFEAEFDRIMSGVAVSPDKPADTDNVTKANSLPVTSTPNIKQYKAPETSDLNSENELERLMSEILEEHEGKPESMEVKVDHAPVSPILHQEDERLPKPPNQDVPKGGRRRKKRPAPPVPTSPRVEDGASSPLQNGSPQVINSSSSTRSSSTSPQRKPRAPPPLPDYILSGGGREGKHWELNANEKQNNLTKNVGNVLGTNQDSDLSNELSIDIPSYDETGDLLGEIMESLCASPTASALSGEFEGKLRDLSLSPAKSHPNTENESAICIQVKDPIASGVSESHNTMDDVSQSVLSSNEGTPRKPPRPKKSPSRRSSSGASYDRKVQDSADSGFLKRKVLFTGDGRENNETSTADGAKSDNVDIDATLSIKTSQPGNTHLTAKPVVKPPPPKSFSVRRSSGQSLYDRMHAVASSGGNLEDFFSGETKSFTSSNETETDIPMKDFEELKPQSVVNDKLHIVPGKVHLQTNEDSFDTLFIDNNSGESSTDPSTYDPELLPGKLNNANSSCTVDHRGLCNKQDILERKEPAMVQARSKLSTEGGNGNTGLNLDDAGVECREEEGERIKEKPVVKPRRSKSNAESKDPKKVHNKGNVVSHHEENVSEKISESALVTDTAAVVKSAECDTKDVCSLTSHTALDAPEQPSNKGSESKPIMAVKPVQKVASTTESSSGQHGVDTSGVTSEEVTPIPPPRRRRKKSFNSTSSLYSNSDGIETIQESPNSGHTRFNEKNVLNTVDVSPVKKVTEPSRTIDSVVEVKRRQKKASRPPHLNKRMSMPVLQEGQLSPAPDTVNKRLSMPGLSASELVLRAQKRLSSAGSSPVVEEKSGSRFSKTREVSKKRRKCTLRRAVQEYEGQEDGELSFHVDSFIKELAEVPERPGWAYGMLADGVTGLYPMDYVEDLIPSRSQSEA